MNFPAIDRPEGNGVYIPSPEVAASSPAFPRTAVVALMTVVPCVGVHVLGTGAESVNVCVPLVPSKCSKTFVGLAGAPR